MGGCEKEQKTASEMRDPAANSTNSAFPHLAPAPRRRTEAETP